MFLKKPPALVPDLSNAVRNGLPPHNGVKSDDTPLMTPVKTEKLPAPLKSNRGASATLSTGGVATRHSYYTRKRQELGFHSVGKMAPQQRSLRVTPALQELIASARGPRDRITATDNISENSVPQAPNVRDDDMATAGANDGASTEPSAAIDVNKANVRVGEKRGELMPPPDNDEWQSREGSEGEKSIKIADATSKQPKSDADLNMRVQDGDGPKKDLEHEAQSTNLADESRETTPSYGQNQPKGFIKIPSEGSPVNTKPTFHHMHPTDGQAISIDDIQAMLDKNKLSRQKRRSPQNDGARPEFRVTG